AAAAQPQSGSRLCEDRCGRDAECEFVVWRLHAIEQSAERSAHQPDWVYFASVQYAGGAAIFAWTSSENEVSNESASGGCVGSGRLDPASYAASLLSVDRTRCDVTSPC